MNLNTNKISNYLINIGIVMSLFSIYIIYKSKVNMPPGTCPIDENNNLIHVSVFISVLGLVLSFIPSKDK